MNFWVIFKIETKCESQAEALIARRGIETYLPMAATINYISAKTNRKSINYIPLIPGILFVKGEPDISGLKYVKGVARSPSGEAWKVSNAEVIQFQSFHARWLEALLKRRKMDIPAKPKYIKISDPVGMAELMRLCFGYEPETENS